MNDATFATLEQLVDSVVAPVFASSWHKRRMREELLSHVVAVFEDERLKIGDEAAAFDRTVQRFGAPPELTRQLQGSITPLGYVAWFFDQAWLLRGEQVKMNHNRLYNAVLVVLACWVLCGVALLAAIILLPADARPPMQVPEWSLPILTAVNGVYLLVMIATFLSRILRPTASHGLTTVLNVLLLLGPPFGTALGIYGLWKVDRPTSLGVTT